MRTAVSLGRGVAPTTPIRTPDQHLRVFISSTLDLMPERRAARAAVERLHLAPVMFELGARPYPPRALYRAYLEQSDVFVGIYARRYGWTAPEETVSGLEDEYALSGDRPKLLYVERACDREPPLDALLERIRQEDQTSYKEFDSADELGRLLEDDLATLLSEHFDISGAMPSREPEPASRLPVSSTSFVGREDAIHEVRALLCAGRARLVTLTGPGGIGKTRLAFEAVRGLSCRYRDGITPVFLEAVAYPEEVLGAMAEALGVADTPGLSRLEMLVAYLRDRRVLLVLDNFEHVIDAAPLVAKLLATARGLRVLVTSRELLNVRGEHGYEVGPLKLPDPSCGCDLGAVLGSESVRLFRDRACAALPGFALDEQNAAAVVEICRKLEGLPLAIELAAARVRMLRACEIASRLDRRLGFLVYGPRDLPERQRTLRATIAWSHGLLSEEERRVFSRLGVFRGGFTLEAADVVCEPGCDLLQVLSSLLDKSLVRGGDGRAGSVRFTMLESIREFALEQLGAAGEEEPVRRRHAAWFREWVVQWWLAFERDLSREPELAASVSDELDNVRAAVRWHLDAHQPGVAAAMGLALWPFWWIRSHFTEARSWMEEVLRSEGLAPRDRATAQLVIGLAAVGQNDYAAVARTLPPARAGLLEAGDEIGAAIASVPLGLGQCLAGDAAGGEAAIREALETFERSHHPFGVCFSLIVLGRVLMLQGRLEDGIAADESAAARMRSKGELMIRSLSLLALAWAYVGKRTPRARGLRGRRGADGARDPPEPGRHRPRARRGRGGRVREGSRADRGSPAGRGGGHAPIGWSTAMAPRRAGPLPPHRARLRGARREGFRGRPRRGRGAPGRARRRSRTRRDRRCRRGGVPGGGGVRRAR
ncbi:DUF4062 domain-containing protein [Anaeromyxobacter soli]|uniref:DUF4062 domain-containing protein n=1 Tax=Anaeromyxobacter soli TaxID=2922725 RepID=UPI001FAFCA3D|nr:DUF4062 domain-containing protein [Anaeromyxobacter sp. SG29]